MVDQFLPAYRGGSGAPLVCLHGFGDTWRTWELVLASLERHHDVLALTLPGHAGGPRIDALDDDLLVDFVGLAMDRAGFERAHIVGNSLGGYVALRLAARDRATSVVALAPAGGWDRHDDRFRKVLQRQRDLIVSAGALATSIDDVVRTSEGIRIVTQMLTERSKHLPSDLVAHLVTGLAAGSGLHELLEFGLTAEWGLDAAAITCPTRIVWGLSDRLLPWPQFAARYSNDLLPHADWVELEGVGHCPQLDVPAEVAALILDFTSAR